MGDGHSTALDAGTIREVFPFHIAVDSDLNIVQFGRSIPRLTPDMSVGDPLLEHWKIMRASLGGDWESLAESAGALVVLESTTGGIRLKGQVVVLESGNIVMFLATPVLGSIEMMTQSGLTLQDFAAHDVVVDFLFALQIRDRTLAEIHDAHDALRERTRNLEDYRAMIDRHVGLVVLDVSGLIQGCNSAFAEIMQAEHNDLEGREFISLLGDSATLFRDGFREVIGGEYNWQGELEFTVGTGEQAWCFTTISRWRSTREGERRFSLIFTDITNRKLAERRQTLMMQELDHRVKNSLATVLSLCHTTAAGTKSTDEYVLQLEERICAMARAHELLASSHWSETDLEELIQVAIGHLAEGHGAILKASGNRVSIQPKYATPLALSFHELATNALKYGGFSVQGGGVQITWAEEGDDLKLTWTESGGPPVKGNGTPGVGFSILTGIVEHEFRGKIEFHFEPGGLVVVIRLPRDRLSRT